jgi:hypothetical protein
MRGRALSAGAERLCIHDWNEDFTMSALTVNLGGGVAPVITKVLFVE